MASLFLVIGLALSKKIADWSLNLNFVAQWGSMDLHANIIYLIPVSTGRARNNIFWNSGSFLYFHSINSSWLIATAWNWVNSHIATGMISYNNYMGQNWGVFLILHCNNTFYVQKPRNSISFILLLGYMRLMVPVCRCSKSKLLCPIEAINLYTTENIAGLVLCLIIRSGKWYDGPVSIFSLKTPSLNISTVLSINISKSVKIWCCHFSIH